MIYIERRIPLLFLFCWIILSATSSTLHHSTTILPQTSRPLLSMPYAELCEVLGGSGRAKMMWESIKKGEHPLLLPPTQGLSERVRTNILSVLGTRPLIETDVTEETLSDCGTRKFLQRLNDGQSVESVLIPAYKFDRTTLCVSTQIGCDRGCAFCLTGKMGLLRNLTSVEILSQVFNGLHIASRENMPPMSNIVFMGMGDSGRNLDAVGDAVHALTDRDRFSMAASKITVSTVGPSPEAFLTLAKMPGTLAWSLHAADDEIRRKLVPSTRHSTVELRDGLVAALKTRPAMRTRTIMIALTLIDGINDSEEDAIKLASFLRPMLADVPKIAIDLIPYNDIEVMPDFRKPSKERIKAFQERMRIEGYFCTVRVTRGEDESSACGMLATKRIKKEKNYEEEVVFSDGSS